LQYWSIYDFKALVLFLWAVGMGVTIILATGNKNLWLQILHPYSSSIVNFEQLVAMPSHIRDHWSPQLAIYVAGIDISSVH